MEQQMNIPFSAPFLTGKELQYVKQAATDGKLAGDGPFTRKCQQWLENNTGCIKALLTPSCTAALEMAAILTDTQPGDEIIMPSYTFVSTANAFVSRGGIPVFVDIREDTLNMDETLVEEAITEKTKAIVPVHYGGVGCEMDVIMALANDRNIYVIEDAAQAIASHYNTRSLGSIGHLGCLSFHETKNIQCGEGGALLVNHPELIERAEIIREKGTNRDMFLRGEVDRYTWVDMGSSYLPNEISAAFLLAQLEASDNITSKRKHLFQYYYEHLLPLKEKGLCRLPDQNILERHNGHVFYLIFDSNNQRDQFIQFMKERDIFTAFHYVPLHSSPAGKRFGRIATTMSVTERIGTCMARIPLYTGMTEKEAERVIAGIHDFFMSSNSRSLPASKHPAN